MCVCVAAVQKDGLTVARSQIERRKKKQKTRADEPVRRGQEGGRGERGRERDLRPVKVEERRGENKMKKKRGLTEG